MTTEQILLLADQEATKLTNEMASIVSDYPEAEAPEFMPAEAYEKWTQLRGLLQGIFDIKERIKQAGETLHQYLVREVI